MGDANSLYDDMGQLIVEPRQRPNAELESIRTLAQQLANPQMPSLGYDKSVPYWLGGDTTGDYFTGATVNPDYAKGGWTLNAEGRAVRPTYFQENAGGEGTSVWTPSTEYTRLAGERNDAGAGSNFFNKMTTEIGRPLEQTFSEVGRMVDKNPYLPVTAFAGGMGADTAALAALSAAGIGFKTGAEGGDLGDAATAAAISYATNYAGQQLGSYLGTVKLPEFTGNFTPAELALGDTSWPGASFAGEGAYGVGGAGSNAAAQNMGNAALGIQPVGMAPINSYNFGGASAPSLVDQFGGGPGVLASGTPGAYVPPPTFQIGGTSPVFQPGVSVVDQTLNPANIVGQSPLTNYDFGGLDDNGNFREIDRTGEYGRLRVDTVDGVTTTTPANPFFNEPFSIRPDLIPTPLTDAVNPFFQVNPALDPNYNLTPGYTAPTSQFQPGGGELYPHDIAGIQPNANGNWFEVDPNLVPANIPGFGTDYPGSGVLPNTTVPDTTTKPLPIDEIIKALLPLIPQETVPNPEAIPAGNPAYGISGSGSGGGGFGSDMGPGGPGSVDTRYPGIARDFMTQIFLDEIRKQKGGYYTA